MTSPVRPRASVIEQPTRQQLDELDALMQRMLALPVSPKEDASSKPTPPQAGIFAITVSPNPQVSGISVAARNNAPQASEKEKEPVSAADNPQGGITAVALKEAAAEPSLGAAPTLVPAELPWNLPLIDTPEKRPQAATAKISRMRIAWWLRPFLWTDQAFEVVTAWLGPLGRWLRGPWGRTAIGCAGILLLAAALAWVALDELGWTW